MIELKTLVEGYRTMCRIRMVEETIAAHFREKKIFSFLHLTTGQEAIAAGVCAALRPQDRVWGNHRSHGHYLAKGGDLYRMLCEIYGKEDGCCRGNGGSMHMLDLSAGFMGSTPILGAIAPIAAGSAFQQKRAGKAEMTAVFIGDGASEEGTVYETINLAAVWELPLIIVIENNLFSVNTPSKVRRAPGFRFDAVVCGLGIPAINYHDVDGNDFDAVYRAAYRARTINGPSVIRATAFREMAHSGPITDESVRVADKKDTRSACDPLTTAQVQLLRRGVIPADLAGFRTEIAAEIAEAYRRMEACPMATPVQEGVYV